LSESNLKKLLCLVCVNVAANSLLLTIIKQARHSINSLRAEICSSCIASAHAGIRDKIRQLSYVRIGGFLKSEAAETENDAPK